MKDFFSYLIVQFHLCFCLSHRTICITLNVVRYSLTMLCCTYPPIERKWLIKGNPHVNRSISSSLRTFSLVDTNGHHSPQRLIYDKLHLNSSNRSRIPVMELLSCYFCSFAILLLFRLLAALNQWFIIQFARVCCSIVNEFRARCVLALQFIY